MTCWGHNVDKKVAENPLFPAIMPGSDTSLELCVIIISLSKAKSFTQQAIARISVHRTPSTVSKILSRYKTLGTLSSAPCPGRLPKVSLRDKQHLLCISLHEQFCSATQVLDSANLSGQITPSCANQIF